MVSSRNISVQLPDGLIEEIDREVELGGYNGRSDFIKAAIRTQLQINYEKRVRFDPKE